MHQIDARERHKMSEIIKAGGVTSTSVANFLATGDKGKFVFQQVDPIETAQRIAERDLNANSLDELLGGGDVISGKNYINKPFQANSVEWGVSEFEGEGLPFYAVIHATSIDGEVLVITCGATSVVRKLAVMDMNGWLPAWVKITKGAKTAGGYEPLDLSKAPQSEIPFAG
jgi:hypothetical protein